MGKFKEFPITKEEIENEHYKNKKTITQIAIENNIKPIQSFYHYINRLGIKVEEHYRHPDILGKEYGFLKVNKFLGVRNNKRVWECLCRKCNNICYLTTQGVRKYKSCGCARGERPCNNKNYNWKGYGEIPKTYFTSMQYGAISRQLEFNITIEFIWELFLKQDRKCALTGKELVFKKTRYREKDPQTASLDRIDPQKGYTQDNLQWVHKDINFMKSRLNNNDFIKYCFEVCDYIKTG